MELLHSVAFIVLGGVGGAGLVWLFFQFGGKIPMEALNPFKKKEENEKKIDIQVIEQEKKEPVADTTADILKQKGDELKKKLKLIALLSLGSLLIGNGQLKALPPSDGLIDNYVETTYQYAVEVDKEFRALKDEARKDTTVIDIEKTPHSRTVLIRIPVRKPVIREDKDTKLMRIEHDTQEPIDRKIKVVCTDAGTLVSQTGSRFWFNPMFGIMASISSAKSFEPQAGLFVNLLHWSNEYMNISALLFAGYKRYGFGISAGPAMSLSNIRLNVGYSREYIAQSEHYIEVGVGSIIYLN